MMSRDDEFESIQMENILEYLPLSAEAGCLLVAC